jgi:hypothetical protein
MHGINTLMLKTSWTVLWQLEKMLTEMKWSSLVVQISRKHPKISMPDSNLRAGN